MSQAVPAGQYFNEFTNAIAGIVSSFSTTSFTAAQTNFKQWLLPSYSRNPVTGGVEQVLINPKYNHDYFWNLYRDKVNVTTTKNDITSGDLHQPIANPDGSSNPYPTMIAIHPASGTRVTLKTPGNLTGGKLSLVFINRLDGVPVDFFIDDRVEVDANSFVIFLVSGNVIVDSDVNKADGYYIIGSSTSGTGIYSSGQSQTQLTVWGGVAAYGGFNLQRRMAAPTTPAEVFTYNPIITKFAGRIGESNYNWQETVP